MRNRIDVQRFYEATDQVPAPFGTKWEFDRAAYADRLRLFWHESSGRRGQILNVDVDGAWHVESTDPKDYQYAATGVEKSLEDGMRRALLVARALGWDLS